MAFSRLLSDICDRIYDRAPLVANEMLNRSELTSQGAKARRELLERMFTHETQARFGIEGFRPERAMYDAVLHETGLHDQREGRCGFGAPSEESPLADVWSFIQKFLDDATEEARGIDTTTASGRITFHIFGALAEFERELIRERTQAGLAAARARGRAGGRPAVMT